jgi:transcriptional regulator with XRE-family HTH domain
LTFGQMIRLERENLQLSQLEAAAQIHKKHPGIRLSGPYLSMIENDQKNNLSKRLIRALADFYQIAPANVLLLYFSENEISQVAESSANYQISPGFLKCYQSLTEAEKVQAEAYMKFLVAQRKSRETPRS